MFVANDTPRYKEASLLISIRSSINFFSEQSDKYAEKIFHPDEVSPLVDRFNDWRVVLGINASTRANMHVSSIVFSRISRETILQMEFFSRRLSETQPVHAILFPLKQSSSNFGNPGDTFIALIRVSASSSLRSSLLTMSIRSKFVDRIRDDIKEEILSAIP